jgi:hypothetical protein
MCVQYNRADSGQGLLSFGAAREFFSHRRQWNWSKWKKHAQPREEKREENYCGNNSVYLLGTFPFVATLRCNSTKDVLSESGQGFWTKAPRRVQSLEKSLVRGGHRKVLVSGHECGAVVSALVPSSFISPHYGHARSQSRTLSNKRLLIAACFDFGMFQLSDAAWAWN